MSSLKQHLADALEEDILDVGYIEPGHGMKGKQVWLVEDSDVAEMYSRFKTKQDITLWCSSYSVKKLNVWAHMLHIEKHNSYDEPPNVPYFTKSRKIPVAKADFSEESLYTSAPTSSSPSKCVSVRSECIDQLKGGTIC